MKRISIWSASWLASMALAAPALGHGKPSWSIGVSVGTPGHYCPYPHYYYRPWVPVYVPPPVYVAPAPVVVPPPAVIQPAVPAEPALPSPRPLPSNLSRVADLQPHLRNLADPDEGVRISSVTQLGRSKSEQAIDPLAATLSGDQSPAVREAAARALGVIGSAKALPALTRAAQLDADRDVRRSAQFAVEIIQSH